MPMPTMGSADGPRQDIQEMYTQVHHDFFANAGANRLLIDIVLEIHLM